jgi:hypothetical protein
MFGSQKVKQETIMTAAIHIMALPLPADRPKVQTSEHPDHGIITVQSPSIDGMQTQFIKTQGEYFGGGTGRVASTAIFFITQNNPAGRRFEIFVNIMQSNHPDRRILRVRCEYPEEINVPLNHNL